jgi:hypothetical protein
MGMGLSFSEIEPGQLAVLERWLAELSGEVAPEPKALKEDQIRSEGNSEHELR